MNLQLRTATGADIPRIHAVYAREVREGVATYEYEAPDEAEMALRLQELLANGYPHSVMTGPTTPGLQALGVPPLSAPPAPA